MKKSYNNYEFKISALIWNDKFELPDGSYSISDLQDYFEYTFKKKGEKIDNTSIRIYVKKMKIELCLILKQDTNLSF